VGQIGFVADIFLAVAEKLGEVSESFGATSGDASGADEFEEFSDDVVDIGGGAELAGDGRELLSDIVEGEKLMLLASVENAEGGMGLVTQHAALATVGEGELTEVLLAGGDSRTGLLDGFHLEAPEKMRW
jgi:hypothetical protein